MCMSCNKNKPKMPPKPAGSNAVRKTASTVRTSGNPWGTPAVKVNFRGRTK